MKQSSTKKMMVVTMLVAISVFLNMFEPAVPIPVPGVRFGLANTMGLLALLMFDLKTMVQIQLVRVLLGSLLKGTFLGIGFWMSLGGAVASCLALALIYRKKDLSPIGLSLASAYFHNLGQMLAMLAILKTLSVIYWLPVMLGVGLVTGFLTGWIVRLVLRSLRSKGAVYET